jgi:hypothetical protein
MRLETEPTLKTEILGCKVEVYYDPLESRLAPVKQYRVYVNNAEVALVEKFPKTMLTKLVKSFKLKSYTLHVVVVDLELGRREFAEAIENMKFDSVADYKKFAKELNPKGDDPDYAELFTISDFMQACNDEEIGLIENWISYVYLKESYR